MSNPKRPINFVGARLASLPVAPLVKSAIPCRAGAKAVAWPRIRRKTPTAGAPVRAPFFPPESDNVARIAGFPLPEFPAEDSKTDRPKHDEAQNHRENFDELPRLSPRTAMPVCAARRAVRGCLIGHS